MTMLEIEETMGRMGELFPEWKPRSAETQQWRDRLAGLGVHEVRNALDRLWETTRRLSPSWAEMAKFLPTRRAERGPARPPEAACWVQCVEDGRTVRAGTFFACSPARAKAVSEMAEAQHGGQWTIRSRADGWSEKGVRDERHRCWTERTESGQAGIPVPKPSGPGSGGADGAGSAVLGVLAGDRGV